MDACKPRIFFNVNDVMEKEEEINNIVRFSYSILSQKKPFNQGPPSLCRGCGASLCKYSELLTRNDYYNKLSNEERSLIISDEKKAQLNDKDKTTDFLKGKYLKDLSVEEVAWICEFCGVHNRLSKNISKPKSEDELYLLKKVPELGKNTSIFFLYFLIERLYR